MYLYIFKDILYISEYMYAENKPKLFCEIHT